MLGGVKQIQKRPVLCWRPLPTKEKAVALLIHQPCTPRLPSGQDQQIKASQLPFRQHSHQQAGYIRWLTLSAAFFTSPAVGTGSLSASPPGLLKGFRSDRSLRFETAWLPAFLMSLPTLLACSGRQHVQRHLSSPKTCGGGPVVPHQTSQQTQQISYLWLCIRQSTAKPSLYHA